MYVCPAHIVEFGGRRLGTCARVENVCKVFTGLKGLSLVNDAFPSAGATMCEVHARRSGQKVVITDPSEADSAHIHGIVDSVNGLSLATAGPRSPHRRCPGTHSTHTHQECIT